MLQQISLGGMMIALPIFLQMVLEYNALQSGLSLAPLSLSMFAIALLAGKRAGKRRPSSVIRAGFLLAYRRADAADPVVPRADPGWSLVIPLLIAGSGLGMMVSQLNNYTLVPDLRGADQRGGRRELRGGIFGLSFGLAFAGAIMLATLSFAFTNMAEEAPCFTATSSSRSPTRWKTMPK